VYFQKEKEVPSPRSSATHQPGMAAIQVRGLLLAVLCGAKK